MERIYKIDTYKSEWLPDHRMAVYRLYPHHHWLTGNPTGLMAWLMEQPVQNIEEGMKAITTLRVLDVKRRTVEAEVQAETSKLPIYVGASD